MGRMSIVDGRMYFIRTMGASFVAWDLNIPQTQTNITLRTKKQQLENQNQPYSQASQQSLKSIRSLKQILSKQKNQQPTKHDKNLTKISSPPHNSPKNCQGHPFLPARSPTAPAASKWPPLPPWLPKPARSHPLPRLHGIRSHNWWSSRRSFFSPGVVKVGW